MSNKFDLDVAHKIKADKPIDPAKVLAFMQERLLRISNSPTISNDGKGNLHFKGNIKGTLKFIGVNLNINVLSEGNSARIKIDGKQYSGLTLWIVDIFNLILVFLSFGASFLFFPFFLFFIIARFSVEKRMAKMPKEFIDKLVKETDIEFS